MYQIMKASKINFEVASLSENIDACRDYFTRPFLNV